MRRRDVLKLAGTSGLGMSAVAFAGCGTPDREFHIQSPVDIPEDTVTGLDTWYASICQDSSDGCGIIVRVMSGRARKIEGNPDYPLNRGKTSARAQAALQTLYNPDRIPNPMVPRSRRGSGQIPVHALGGSAAGVPGKAWRRTRRRHSHDYRAR